MGSPHGAARRAQLVGDPEDPVVVDATRLAARRSDELCFARHRGERPERRRHALPVQGDDLIRRWRAATGLLEECGGLATPDPCHLVPALGPSGGSDGALRGVEIQVPRGSDGLDRQRRDRRPPPELGRRAAQPARDGASGVVRGSRPAVRSRAGVPLRRPRPLPRSGRSHGRLSAGRRSGGGSSGRAVCGQGADRAPRRSSGRQREKPALVQGPRPGATQPPSESRRSRRSLPDPEDAEGTRSGPPRFVGTRPRVRVGSRRRPRRTTTVGSPVMRSG